ncbi:hypothetical protein AVANS14531_08055 [Campylobacter sp. Cr9]|uniref:glycosyltransferase n=1 Tax=Campylobacter sp. Cr9 TaxID=2735728 RepID=UPI00301485F9|nr:hypothetical protein [Campylobacter sp. Cr9]
MENKYGLSLIVPIGIENDENIQALHRLESLIVLYNNSKLNNTELIVSECGSNIYFKEEIKKLCHKYGVTYTSVNENLFLSGLARNHGSLIAKYKFLGFIDIDLRFSTNLFMKIFSKIKQLQMNKKKNIFFTIPVFYLNKDFSVRLLNSENSDYEINNLANEYFNHNDKTKVEYYSHVSSFIVVNKHHFYSIGGNDLDYKGHGFEDFDLLYRLIYEEGIIPKPTNHLIDKRTWNFNSYDGLRSYFAIKSIYNDCLNDNIYTVHLWHERQKNTSFYKKNNNRIIYKSKFNNFDLSGKHPKPLSFRENNCIFFGEKNEIKNLKDILPFIGNIKLYNENQEYDLNNDFCFIHPIKDKYKEIYCKYKNIQKINYYEIKEKNNFYNISFNNKEILKVYFLNHNNIKIFYKFLFENNALNYSTKMNKKISINLINKIKNIKYVNKNKKINLKNTSNIIHISNIIISRYIDSIKTSKIKIIFNRFRKNPYYFFKKIFKEE